MSTPRSEKTTVILSKSNMKVTVAFQHKVPVAEVAISFL